MIPPSTNSSPTSSGVFGIEGKKPIFSGGFFPLDIEKVISRILRILNTNCTTARKNLEISGQEFDA
jgi:hypothetical protein